MKTKAKIVEKLLEKKHITAEEAVVLLRETNTITNFPRTYQPVTGERENDMVPYGEICSCNPKNGGSGICGCVIGNKLVPRATDMHAGFWTKDITFPNE